jgi:hypothetical protein
MTRPEPRNAEMFPSRRLAEFGGNLAPIENVSSIPFASGLIARTTRSAIWSLASVACAVKLEHNGRRD